MKKNILFVPIIALFSMTFVGCGDVIAPGELPFGGKEIENSKAILQLASTMSGVDSIDNMGLALDANFELLNESKYGEEELLKEHIKLNNIHAEVKVNGLTTATSLNEIKASATLSLDYDLSLEGQAFKQEGVGASLYVANSNVYADLSNLGEDLSSLIVVPEETGKKIYSPIELDETVKFPLLQEGLLDGLLSSIEVDMESFNELGPIVTAKDYGNKIAIAVDLNADTYGKAVELYLYDEIEEEKRENPEFDVEAAKAQVPAIVEEYKTDLSEDINYVRGTIVFNEDYIEELSFAVDALVVNDVDDNGYAKTRLVADLGLRFLVGNEAKVNLPSLEEYKEFL